MDATDTQHEATDEAAISPSPAHVRSGEANAGVPNEATVAPFHPPALGVNGAKQGQIGPVLDPPVRELTRKQELAMPHILSARSEREGARAAQISRSTLQRWMDNPGFRAELEDQRRAAAALTHHEFQELALSSMHILAELLKDPSPYIRLNAVRTTINAAMKIEDSQDIRRRISVIDDSIELLKDQS